MMTSPLISVIVPVYNVEKYLEECIGSIVAQDYENLEIILVDDGSTDRSGDLCDRWAERDERILVIHKPNGGQASARNTALDIASGVYISFIDSDDAISPSSLYSSIIHIISQNEYSFVQIPIMQAGTTRNAFADIEINNRVEMYAMWIDGKRITNYMCDKIWNRRLFEGLRFKEGMIFEDRYLFPELVNRCDKILLTDKGEYFYRTHEGQTTARKRDASFLSNMLEADIHILETMPQNLNNLRAKVQNRMFSTFLELIQIVYEPSLAHRVRKSIKLHSSMSLRMLAIKIFGTKIYNVVFN